MKSKAATSTTLKAIATPFNNIIEMKTMSRSILQTTILILATMAVANAAPPLTRLARRRRDGKLPS